MLAGIATALTLPMVRYAGEVLRGGAVSAILLLAALAVFVPAALLSAVTPLVVKLQLGDLRRTGQVVGRLSEHRHAGRRSPPPWSPASCWSRRCRAR